MIKEFFFQITRIYFINEPRKKIWRVNPKNPNPNPNPNPKNPKKSAANQHIRIIFEGLCDIEHHRNLLLK